MLADPRNEEMRGVDHNEGMEWALQQAHQAMPEDFSEPQEGELIDLIEKAKGFRRKLREVGLEAKEEEE